jgi:hypothetical protein
MQTVWADIDDDYSLADLYRDIPVETPLLRKFRDDIGATTIPVKGCSFCQDDVPHYHVLEAGEIVGVPDPRLEYKTQRDDRLMALWFSEMAKNRDADAQAQAVNLMELLEPNTYSP